MSKPWEDIIHTALIGTDRKLFNKQLVPEDLSVLLGRAEQITDNKEEQFLNMASMIYTYKRTAEIPVFEPAAAVSLCEDEEKPYCSHMAISALQAILDDGNISFLYYWIYACQKAGQLVSPAYIPALLDIAAREVEMRELAMEVMGRRGKWLKQFNPSWDFSAGLSYTELFDHGKTAERKKGLEEWRKIAPVEAREALAGTWKQEQAIVRAELVGTFKTGLSKEDEPFIADAWKDKSQKVKEVALDLLKHLPESFVVQEVWTLLKTLVHIKQSSSFAGFIKKEFLEISQDFELPVQFKSYGISELDASKRLNEKQTTLFHMIRMIPPHFWERHLMMNAADILDLFDRQEGTSIYIEAIGEAADNFMNVEWSLLMFSRYEIICPQTVKEFPQPVREEVVIRQLDMKNQDIHALMPDPTIEWSHAFVLRMLEITALEPYIFTRHFYNRYVHHFPPSVADRIDRIKVEDPLKKDYWKRLSEDILKMLDIKQQIIQSF